MRKLLLVIVSLLLIPVFLVAFVSIHEIGHTTLARLLGDPDSVFTLVRIDEQSRGFGQTSYDVSKLSWEGNLVVSLGGILATQSIALAALFLLRFTYSPRWLGRVLGVIALAFAFLDLPFQLFQALTYSRTQRTWPTGVDLMDFMLLLQMNYPIRLDLLKLLLLVASFFYLVVLLWLYKRNRAWQESQKTKPLS